jgi:hypothetical protein
MAGLSKHKYEGRNLKVSGLTISEIRKVEVVRGKHTQRKSGGYYRQIGIVMVQKAVSHALLNEIDKWFCFITSIPINDIQYTS